MKRRWKILLIGLIALSIGIALNYENIKYLPFTSTPERETEIEPLQETEPSQETEFPQEIETSQETISGKIAFLSTRTYVSSGIYTMNADGSNQTKLYSWTIYYPDLRCTSTNSPTLIAPSPDGEKIAFVGPGLSPGEEGWKEDIYLVNIDGNDLIKLTNGPERDSNPRWSPDGKKIVFASSRDGGFKIYVMDADGGNQIILNNKRNCIEPDWSPDGKKIVFVTVDLAFSIYIMDADGSNPTAVGAIGRYPKWSPDGKKIVFQSLYTYPDPDKKPYYVWEICVADVSEGNLARTVKLTNEDPLNPYSATNPKIGEDYEGHRNPSWSPDGKKIFFDLSLNNDIEIYVMNADGSNRVKLTETFETNQYPVWLPTP